MSRILVIGSGSGAIVSALLRLVRERRLNASSQDMEVLEFDDAADSAENNKVRQRLDRILDVGAGISRSLEKFHNSVLATARVVMDMESFHAALDMVLPVRYDEDVSLTCGVRVRTMFRGRARPGTRRAQRTHGKGPCSTCVKGFDKPGLLLVGIRARILLCNGTICAGWHPQTFSTPRLITTI